MTLSEQNGGPVQIASSGCGTGSQFSQSIQRPTASQSEKAWWCLASRGHHRLHGFAGGTLTSTHWRRSNWTFLRSGGVVTLPETAFSPARYYAVKADKENYLWVMDRTLPGGYNGGGSNPNCGSVNQNCSTPCANSNLNVEQLAVASNHYTGAQARSTPAFWSGIVSTGDRGELYFAANGTGAVGQLKRYPVSTSCSTPPICSPVASTNVDPTGTGLGYAATPSVSSNPSYQNGIVWAMKVDPRQTTPALFAFDAGSLTELWDSRACVDVQGNPRDQPGVPTKFSVPTIANGFVYIGTQTDFDIYGVVSSRSCTPGD